MSHGHDDSHAPIPPPPPAGPPPPHVLTIARLSKLLGLALWVVGFFAAWYLLYFTSRGLCGFATAGFVSLYGMCIWLAARSTQSAATA